MAGPSNRSDDPSDGVACLNLVGLPRLMARTSGRPEIAIGLIDGPVALDHPDLAADNIREVSGKLPATCADAEDAACAHCTFIAGILLARRYQRVQLSEEADMPVTPVPQPPAADAVLVFLHGAGEIGGDPNLRAKVHGPWRNLPGNIRALREIDRLHVLGIHLPAGNSWVPHLNDVNTELNNYIRNNNLNGLPICITGVSIGGEGALHLADTRLSLNPPQPLFAVAAFCPEWTNGLPSPQTINRLGAVRSYMFCHRGDHRFGNAQLVARQLGGNCHFREIDNNELVDPTRPHVCWSRVYGCPDFYRALVCALPPNQWQL